MPTLSRYASYKKATKHKVTRKVKGPSPEEIATRIARFNSSLKPVAGHRSYADFFTPESIRIAASEYYPEDAVRLECKFCDYMSEIDGESPNLDFGDLVQFASSKTDRDKALILMVASNLCLLH